MKITSVKAFTMDAFRTNWTFIKVETDDGIYGWGEASLGTNEMALEGMVKDLERHIVGRDPFETEKLMFEVYRDMYWKGGPVLFSALSGIEMACWDIKGKALGVPVSKLLGGKVVDKVKMYANAWFVGAREPEEFARKAKNTVKLGVKALKWDPFGKEYRTISHAALRKASDIVGAVRNAVGDDVELLIECHGRFYPAAALAISRELAQYHPMFLEEPCVPDHMDSMAYVREHSEIPIAAGERGYGIYAFQDILEKNCVDFLQPDIFHAGGIMVGKKVAAMAEAKHIQVSFHNPSGPVSNAAILQLASTIPNFIIHEIMLTDGSFRSEVSTEEVHFDDGYILVPDKPGFGIDLNEEVLTSRPYKPRNLRHYTGTVTDIRPVDDTHYYFKELEHLTYE